jgi:hypothetical protein
MKSLDIIIDGVIQFLRILLRHITDHVKQTEC